MTTQIPDPEWARLTPDEKRERRFHAWLEAPGFRFVSGEAKAAYRGRVARLIDAIKLKKPDRVPVTPALGEFMATYAGYTQKDITYDAEKIVDAATRCTLELDFDAKTNASTPQGKVWEILENKQRNWPGYNLPDNGSPQFVEGEYMIGDEYDSFIADETEFRWNSYLPRIWGAGAGLTRADLSGMNIGPFGLPEVQAALNKLMQAGVEARKWETKIAAANRKLTELGYPDLRSAVLMTAPFDYIGDNLRGQRGVAVDMYRRPGKLLEALDVITRKRLLRIRKTASTIVPGGSPIVGFPLHKGADGFMSDEQFRTFYWPSLRRIVLALVEEGFVPELRTQGSYNTRLRAVRDLPTGSVLWHFYQTDIRLAKHEIGNTQCMVGSVPQSLLQVATPAEVESYCRYLIEVAGTDGGFMVCSPGALGKEASVENVRAMVRAVKTWGVY